MRNTIARARISVLLSLLVIGLTVAAVPVASAGSSGYENVAIGKDVHQSASAVKNTSKNHTLVIKTTGGSVTYSVSASEKISISSAKNESVDSTQGMSVTGRLGKKKKKSKDTTDVITYSGYIESFEHRSNGNDIRVFLNGKLVPPAVLTANHIRISSPKTASGNKSQFAQYRVSVSGRIIKGESTEKKDTAKAGTIRGRINGGEDSFYFTGNPTSISGSGQAVVIVNDQKFSTDQNGNSKPSTTPEPSSTEANTPGEPTDSQQETQTEVSRDSMGTNPATQSADDTGKNQNSTGPGDSSSNDGSGSSSGNGFLYGLAGGVLVMGVLGFAALKYIRPRRRRW
jgi:hypothetical protein